MKEIMSKQATKCAKFICSRKHFEMMNKIYFSCNWLAERRPELGIKDFFKSSVYSNASCNVWLTLFQTFKPLGQLRRLCIKIQPSTASTILASPPKTSICEQIAILYLCGIDCTTINTAAFSKLHQG